ncbi:MAG TPA: AAA family ATPase [Candidatus Eisenbergiella merdipullorum]|uniref:AAA family ATPase n=1 Tax=Candidatus Eisenbergiella merdipullorum TaxID=2838553 RepID=A0A9D2I6K8_9FIRM|nr:AAA family ATPase [Candidatus Eisenbergiella merdipullorum]
MHFESVTMENFKAIDRMQITFQPGINLLIGDNGAGKTA